MLEMKHPTFMVLLLVFTSVLLVSASPREAQKPTTARNVPLESRGVPATVRDLWDQSDAVLLLTVGSSKPSLYRQMVFTFYEVRVEQVFKGVSIQVGATLRLRRLGGTFETSDRIETVETTGYPPFATGDRLIMFLRSTTTPEDGTYFYEMTRGPDSTYQMPGGSAAPITRGVSALAKQLGQSGPKGLLAALARLRDNR